MNPLAATDRSEQLLLILFSIFVAASTFSIALAQTALGLSLLTFLYQNLTGRQLVLTDQTKPIFLLMSAFVLWQIITSVAAAGLAEGLADVQNLALLLILPIGLQLMRSEKNLKHLLQLLAIFVLIGSTAGIIQFFSGVGWPGVEAPNANDNFGYRAQGLFSASMTFAHCFVIPVVLFLSLGLNQLRNRTELISNKLCLFAGGLGSLAILLSFSRGAIVGLTVALIWIALRLKKQALLYMMVILITVAGLSSFMLPDLNQRFAGILDKDLNSQMYTGRLYIWQRSVEMISDSPIIGVGRTNFTSEYVSHMEGVVPTDRLPGDAHNDWLSIITIAGIPGGLLLLAIWLAVIRGIKRSRGSDLLTDLLTSASIAAIISILTMGLFASLFEDAEVIHLIMLVWLFGLASHQIKINRENS